MPADPPHPFVSRGGIKLRRALDTFAIDPRGLVCADFGCSTGGFTDCLLQAGAAHVTAVDTGYGTLAWKLRTDPRVTVLERTNALHAEPTPPDERPELVVIDLGWTPQRLAVPAALRWLKPGGRIVSLIKPHYELTREESGALLRDGVLEEADAQQVADRTVAQAAAWGARVLGVTRSPIAGSKEKARGNAEWLAFIEPLAPPLIPPPPRPGASAAPPG